MKTIVSPTDFSEISLNAVNYAADLALVIGTHLSLLHVCPIPMAFSEMPSPVISMAELEKNAMYEMERLKVRIMDRTGGRLKVYTEVRQGDVVSRIEDFCSGVDTYAIVMGAESTGALERLLVGGKALEAVKRLSWPVIIVPQGVKFTSLRKIGMACDFRNVVESIPAKEIREMISSTHAQLHVIHVSEEEGSSFSDEKIGEAEWLQDILGDLDPKYHFIRGKDAETSLINFADKGKFDMLIIIPKKHSALARILRHQFSKQVVLHAHVPVMAIHE